MVDAFYRADRFCCAGFSPRSSSRGSDRLPARGKKTGEKHDVNENADIALILGGVVTLLALMLGFTFTMSGTRFELRRQLVVDEANAIGTTYLRTWTVPTGQDAEMRGLLRKYVALRVGMAKPHVETPEGLRRLVEGSKRLQDSLWVLASALAREKPSPVVALLLQTLNQMIDVGAMRLAAFHNGSPLPYTWCFSWSPPWPCGFSATTSGRKEAGRGCFPSCSPF